MRTTDAEYLELSREMRPAEMPAGCRRRAEQLAVALGVRPGRLSLEQRAAEHGMVGAELLLDGVQSLAYAQGFSRLQSADAAIEGAMRRVAARQRGE